MPRFLVDITGWILGLSLIAIIVWFTNLITPPTYIDNNDWDDYQDYPKKENK